MWRFDSDLDAPKKMTKRKPKELHEKVGRPTLMTPDTVKKLEEAFSLGCSDLEACLYADISKQTLYNYQEKNPAFIDRKEMLKDKLVLKARSNIAKSLSAGDNETSKWYLERKKKAEFSTKQEVENSGSIAIQWHEEKTYETEQKTDQSD